ncbi:ferric reductase [Paenibacillus sediminis]|uniref:Ferric reductase n=1 Tax=Paenibacillus sediminis TaxID=664909 RepID=A0ABS4H5T1_9BACL|nr:ferric reductase [Paenibacillus sediminis]MBP1937861.1 putative ferric reductase [Paenibacillus sediminis]
MTEILLHLPTWIIIRGLGLMSYCLLFLGIVLGILYGMPFIKGKSKGSMYKWHMRMTWSGFIAGMLHGLILIIDLYSPFHWKEIMIPFAAHHHPILSGLGTLSLYGMLIVLFTTDLRGIISRKIWLVIHLLSYPIFVMTIIHGIFLGSDTRLGVVKMIYLGTGSAVILITLARFISRGNTRSKMQPARARQQV